MVPLPSHRLNQWGQLREILGGVRHPECAAEHSSIAIFFLRENGNALGAKEEVIIFREKQRNRSSITWSIE